MALIYFSILMGSFVAALIVSQYLLTIVHELGHGVVALLLTRSRIDVFVGTMGDRARSFVVPVPYLHIWFSRDPRTWNHGVTYIRSYKYRAFRRVLIVFCGPFAALCAGFMAAYLPIASGANDVLCVTGIAFFIASVYGFIRNLIPSRKPVPLSDGTVTFNDGQLILSTFKKAVRIPESQLNKVFKMMTDGKYEEALRVLTLLVEVNKEDADIRRWLVYCLYSMRRFREAEAVSQGIREQFGFVPDDYVRHACIYADSGRYEMAKEMLEEALLLSANQSYALNGMGYTLNKMEQYSEAVVVLKKVVVQEPEFAYGHCNLGYSLIMLGELEEGLQRVKKSLQLDASNAFGYYCLGIYYRVKGQYPEALTQFLLARDRKPVLIDVEDCIADVRQMITGG